MLIAISGSQGAGKSTLLTKLQQKGYPVVERKTSRSILSDWNITLDEVNQNPELCTRFQDEITKRKFNDEWEFIKSNKVFLTERTHTDLFVYALMNLGKLNEYHEWINAYYETCKNYNKHYSGIFYIPGGQFAIEADGVRGSNPHYGKMIDLTMSHYLEQMKPLTNEIKYITMSDIDERVKFVETAIQELIR